MDQLYIRVAQNFKEKVYRIFANEQSLQAEFSRNFNSLEFTRTDHWSGILYRVFRDSWLEAGPAVKAEPTSYDKMHMLRALSEILDYNLFTQVLLNLQGYVGMAYAVGDANKEMTRLQEKWAGRKPSPFDEKPKMFKMAATPVEQEFNVDLSTLKALRIIAAFTPQISFRVSPMGSTPALADSKNLSMIGVGGDKYIRTIGELRVYFFSWTPGSGPEMAKIDQQEGFPNGLWFWATGIEYPFQSKSGGDILQEVLFTRMLMHKVYRAIDSTTKVVILLPRMASLLIITQEGCQELKDLAAALKTQYPMLEFSEGARYVAPNNDPAVAAGTDGPGTPTGPASGEAPTAN